MLKQIPDAGFSPREAEIVLGLSWKRMYALIREKKIDAYRSVDGSVKISRDELIRFARKQERIREAMES